MENQELIICDRREIVIILMTLCLPTLHWFAPFVFYSGGIVFVPIAAAFIFLVLAPNASLQVSDSSVNLVYTCDNGGKHYGKTNEARGLIIGI